MHTCYVLQGRFKRKMRISIPFKNTGTIFSWAIIKIANKNCNIFVAYCISLPLNCLIKPYLTHCFLNNRFQTLKILRSLYKKKKLQTFNSTYLYVAIYLKIEWQIFLLQYESEQLYMYITIIICSKFALGIICW